jgi:mannitol-specific phosphotransferase system IIBC component
MSSESPRFLGPNTDYFLLWLVIISGVAIGNLVSNFITAKFLEAQAAQVASDVNAAVRQKAAEAGHAQDAQQAADEQAQEAQMAQQLEQQRDERRSDANGQQLSRACAEWTRANTSMHTYTTQSEMNKYCARLERHVDTGVLAAP